MIFIIITTKKNTITKLNYYSQTLIHCAMKFKQKMFIKSFGKTNKKVIGKSKYEASGVIIKECIGLRSKTDVFKK